MKAYQVIILVGVVCIGVIFALGNPISVINAGETGIKVTLGRFDPVPLNPGMHFHIPFFQRVIVVDSKIKLLNFSNSDTRQESSGRQSMLARPAIATLDKKGLNVLIDASIQYSLNQAQIPQTISEYTLDWDQRLVVVPAQGIVRDVLGRYSAEELPNRRDEIATKILNALRDYLTSIPNRPVQLQSFQLKNILLPQAVQEQIQLVQVAQQEATRAKEEIARVKEEAEKAIEQARGEAEAKRINAQGIADAIMIEAQARKEANQVLKKSLNEKLLELRTIEVQGKFNDALKENKDAKIFLTPGGSTPNLWIDTKDGDQSNNNRKRIISSDVQQR